MPFPITNGLLTILVFFLGHLSARSQTSFFRIYPEDAMEYGYSVDNTLDNRYVLTGFSLSGSFQYARPKVIKADETGAIEWEKIIDFQTDAIGNSIRNTLDSGYIIGGIYDLNEVLLVKLDKSGDTVWTNVSFGEWSESREGYCVRQNSDTGYIICGSARLPNRYPRFLLIRTDQNGDTLWTRRYGSDTNCFYTAYAVEQTADGGFIVSGIRKSLIYPNGWDKLFLVRTDGNGDTLWTRTYNNNINENFLDAMMLHTTSDSGYVAGGSISTPYGWEMCMFRIGKYGDSLWSRKYGLKSTNVFNDDFGNSVDQTPDNGFVLCGSTTIHTFLGDDNFSLLIRINAEGDTLWSRIFKDELATGQSVRITPDGGFVFSGQTSYSNMILVRTDTEGLITSVPDERDGIREMTIGTDANGTTFFLEMQPDFKRIEVLSLQGKVIFRDVFEDGMTKYRIDMSPFPDGIYLINVGMTDGSVIRKISVVR